MGIQSGAKLKCGVISIDGFGLSKISRFSSNFSPAFISLEQGYNLTLLSEIRHCILVLGQSEQRLNTLRAKFSDGSCVYKILPNSYMEFYSIKPLNIGVNVQLPVKISIVHIGSLSNAHGYGLLRELQAELGDGTIVNQFGGIDSAIGALPADWGHYDNKRPSEIFDYLAQYVQQGYFVVGFLSYDHRFISPLDIQNYIAPPSGKISTYIALGLPILAISETNFQYIEECGVGVYKNPALGEKKPMLIVQSFAAQEPHYDKARKDWLKENCFETHASNVFHPNNNRSHG